MVKNLPANAGDIRDMGSIPVPGRSPGGGHSDPLQCSCLENPMDRGAWWATVHGDHKHDQVTNSLTFNPATLDVWRWAVPCCGGCPGH